MAAKQNITQAITQAVIEAAKAVIMTVKEENNPLLSGNHQTNTKNSETLE